jgi:hypothetical protein
MRNHWQKFYPCDCQGEGVMLSYVDYDDEIASIDLAYFANHPQYVDNRMTLYQRLRWCWQILTKGQPFTDMVILNQATAKQLGEDLLKFGNGEMK